jgi:hypothetical protein
VDVAVGGSARPETTVVVSSGVHGPEGVVGSAVQQALLNATRPHAGGRVVLVHALNPFGWTRLRRGNEDNVDLNRNCLVRRSKYRLRVAPESDYTGCPALYARIDGLLNPRRPPRRFEAVLPRALWAVARHGRPALRQAIAGGQHEYPQGLFFGGRGPSRTQRLLARHLPDWVGEASHILHLDVHTGLGPWGRLQLLVNRPLITPAGRRLADAAGAWVLNVPSAGRGEGYYQVSGDVVTFCQALFPDRAYDAVCAEFGTYSAFKVLAALRTENQTHHWCRTDDPATGRAKASIREAFAPADPDWRRAVIFQGVQMVRLALEGRRAGPARCFAS